MMQAWISGLLLSLGVLFCLVSAVGLLRMPDLLTRMHAASVLDTLGAAFILLGLMVLSGWNAVSAKLLIVALLIFFTSPAVSHALAKSAREQSQAGPSAGEDLWKP